MLDTIYINRNWPAAAYLCSEAWAPDDIMD
jgi:hypothetical protein